MRMPRVRFTVGRMMVGVAAFALLLAIPLQVARLARLRALYLGLAADNARWETIWLRTEQGWAGQVAQLRATLDAGDLARRARIAEADETARQASQRADLFARRRLICERLASHPWESVPPDPAGGRPAMGHDGPVLMFETSAFGRLDFSPGLIARCAFAPLLAVLGYAALRRKPRTAPLPEPLP